MGLNLFFDPLFRLPLAAGLVAAVILPLLGNLLRLRNEWLAALGLAHISATGALAGIAVGIPALWGASIGALLAAVFKHVTRSDGNSAYALMILVGWSASLLLAANTPLGESLGHALVDGQLYFAGWPQLLGLAGHGVIVLLALSWLTRRLVRARFFPHHEQANRLPAWRWHLSFELLMAGGIALGTATIGVMAAFSLVFIPPWVAFRIAPGWRQATWLSVGIAVVAYLLAFALALGLDQPFGPVLTAVLLILAMVVAAVIHRPLRLRAKRRSGEDG